MFLVSYETCLFVHGGRRGLESSDADPNPDSDPDPLARGMDPDPDLSIIMENQ
jgi:hypothetical protein